MDRLAKKCVITSAIIHGTLVLVLLVGPAFLSSDAPPPASEILTIIPDIASMDGAAVNGFGTPNGGLSQPKPLPPTPKPPEPVPPTPKPVEKAPEPRDEPKPVVNTSKPADPTEPSDKPRKPQINLTEIVRKPSPTTKPNNNADAEKAKAIADAKRKAQRVFETAANNIRSGSATSVDVGPVGVATGTGPSIAAFNDILRTICFNNWHEPSDVVSEDGVVKVTFTIARDGTVISSRITKPSGDAALDRSVQRALDSINTIAPFPDGWKESQRQFQISFNLKAKRSAG